MGVGWEEVGLGETLCQQYVLGALISVAGVCRVRIDCQICNEVTQSMPV